MITPTQQIVCSIVSRHLIADLSPTSHQRVADQSQPISNQLAINRPPVADRSPTGRRFLGIVVANQSPIDLQPKKCNFDRTVVALVAAVFQSQGSRRQVAVHVWPGLYKWGVLPHVTLRGGVACASGSWFLLAASSHPVGTAVSRALSAWYVQRCFPFLSELIL